MFATAHHAANKLEITPKWEGTFPKDATLVIYMPGRRFRLLADELIDHGSDGSNVPFTHLNIRAAAPAVALSGGVFQNRILLEQVAGRLAAVGLRVLSHRQVPANDGGLSLGQAVVAAARRLAR